MRLPRTATEVLESWLDHLQVEAGASPHTLAAYRRDVGSLLGSLGSTGSPQAPLAALTEDALLAWLAADRRRGAAPASTARRLAALRGFVRFALSLGLLA
ncbi:MAG: site-specific integrase, partial [Planctomycetota bacterium]